MPEGTGFQATGETIRRGAVQFNDPVHILNKAIADLKGAMTAQGNCWGNDESGAAFAKNYVPTVEEFVEVAGKLTQGLGQISPNLEKAANLYQDSDNKAQRTISEKRL